MLLHTISIHAFFQEKNEKKKNSLLVQVACSYLCCSLPIEVLISMKMIFIIFNCAFLIVHAVFINTEEDPEVPALYAP